MPIIIITENVNNFTKLSESSNRIQGLIDTSIIKNTPIIISDEINGIELSGLPESLIQNGLGLSKGNVWYENRYCHLAMINIPNCNRIDLEDDEFDATVSHELGHLLNIPELEIAPSGFEPENIKERMQVNKRNGDKKEYYADFYSIQLTSADALLRSFVKYRASDLASNEDSFIKRIEKINSHSVFWGTSLALKTINAL